MTDTPAREPLTFCTPFLSLRRYVEETYGAGAFKRVREGLLAEHGIDLPPIAASTWYPTRTLVRGLEVARDTFGDRDLFDKYGMKAAEYELLWTHRLVLRFTSPTWVVSKGGDVWRRTHDTGRWEIKAREGRVRGDLIDFGIVDAEYCRTLTGWLRRASQMTGAANVRMTHPECRARGAKTCVFVGEW